MDLFSLFIEYGPWSWLIIGFVLLALELVLPGGVFVWLGTAAIVTALIRFVIPMDWAREVAVFGLLGILSVLFWLRFVRANGNESDRPLLNKRAERHVGEEIVLNEPITDGFGRVPIGDTIWRVAGPDLPAGRRIRIIGHDGPVLKVEAA
ncbi:MAG TPA: NfeD family protein [Devosiaceae bacterium]|nr:NfeD family protein [Devosiaceae bacterium]